MTLLSFHQVGKAYPRAGVVLEGLDLEVEPGDFVGIWGERRSGKTTLLRLAAGVETPDRGSVRFDGCELAALSERSRSQLRLHEIGMATTTADTGVLVADRSTTVVEHVALPLIFTGLSRKEAADVACRYLRMVGAGECMRAAPFELRPGEGTRVALARALIREPRLLLVDEPAVTHSPAERDAIRDLLHELSRSLRLATLVASEEVSMMAGAPRILSVGDGKVISSETPGTVVPFPTARAAGDES